jgi:1-pyrroline-5-carboxylate dehydrogenase
LEIFEMTTRFRVTYATLSADNEELHAAYEAGLSQARSWLGGTVAPRISGKTREGGAAVEVFSPNDVSVRLGTVRAATETDLDDAVREATAAAAQWRAAGWRHRIAVLRAAADLISERSAELGALMSIEVGKNRLEAIGDVEESADLIRYSCKQIEANDGFEKPMERLSSNESTSSVLRPFGVWGVIAPFNYPMALVAGPGGAALAAGNALLIKPSVQGSFSADRFHQCLLEAGVPAALAHLLPGGDEVGKALVAHPGVHGLTFTGSSAAGMAIYRSFARDYPKPVIAEMGGKNPTIVSNQADLELAVAGVARSAFGLSGQKCSACSRVYVHRDVYDAFVTGLAARAETLVVGDATDRAVYVGPVIDQEAVDRYQRVLAGVRERGGRVVTGGEVLRGRDGLPDGYYLAPTVVTDLRVDDELFRDELFLPLVAVAPVDSVDEGLALANASDYGLTAGFFSADDAEVERFLDTIEAGVVYVNRAAGATTGAWPGVQPFGGWKASGSSGKAGGGLYYVQQYLREQSRTVVAR